MVMSNQKYFSKIKIIEKSSVQHSERIAFHGSQEALLRKPLPQRNAFDTQIALLLVV